VACYWQGIQSRLWLLNVGSVLHNGLRCLIFEGGEIVWCLRDAVWNGDGSGEARAKDAEEGGVGEK